MSGRRFCSAHAVLCYIVISTSGRNLEYCFGLCFFAFSDVFIRNSTVGDLQIPAINFSFHSIEMLKIGIRLFSLLFSLCLITVMFHCCGSERSRPRGLVLGHRAAPLKLLLAPLRAACGTAAERGAQPKDWYRLLRAAVVVSAGEVYSSGRLFSLE